MIGFTLGGLLTGLIIGAAVPLMRRRLFAGLVVGVAATIGLGVAFHFWRMDLGAGVTAFTGMSSGFIYAMLFWEYHP